MSGTADLMNLEFNIPVEESLPDDKMKKLSGLVDRLRVLRGEENEDHVTRVFGSLEKNLADISLATLEGVVRLFKKKEEEISRELIPSILNELNLAELKLVTGEKITVKDEVKASVSESNKRQLISEMIKIEAESRGIDLSEAEYNVKSLFKEKLISDYDSELETELINKGVQVDHKIDIHYQTLNKYVRECLESGLPIPESISVFRYQETKIK